MPLLFSLGQHRALEEVASRLEENTLVKCGFTHMFWAFFCPPSSPLPSPLDHGRFWPNRLWQTDFGRIEFDLLCVVLCGGFHVWVLVSRFGLDALPLDLLGFTQQPENSKRAHLSAPALQTPKFHEKTPRERRERKLWGEGKKKREILGLRGPTLRAPPLGP